MALWLDKYRPKKLSKLDFHRRQAEHLEQLVKGGDFPHLLVYGPSGSGKKTRIMALLRELYGSGVERLRIEHQNFETPSKKKLEIITIASNYHIEVNYFLDFDVLLTLIFLFLYMAIPDLRQIS